MRKAENCFDPQMVEIRRWNIKIDLYGSPKISRMRFENGRNFKGVLAAESWRVDHRA